MEEFEKDYRHNMRVFETMVAGAPDAEGIEVIKHKRAVAGPDDGDRSEEELQGH